MLMLLALAVPAVHTYAHQLTPTQAIERVAGSKRTLCLKAPATRNASASAQAEVVPALTVADPATGQPGIYAIRGAAPTGGILFLAADDADAPAQYFNLQGQLMARPLAPGIYICRQGAHASKVVVR